MSSFDWVVTSVHHFEFFRGEVSELVKTKREIVLFVVDSEDFDIVLGKDVESELIFKSSSVKLVVGELPLRIEVSDGLFFKRDTERADEEE